MALLRHGSAAARADRPGTREDPQLTWAWAALLKGDGGPWMALGSLLLDRPALYTAAKRLGVDLAVERQRWEYDDTSPTS